MQRRRFLQFLSAFGLSPAMPTKALAAASAAPAKLVMNHYTHFMYGHALHLVRHKKELSAAGFRELTGLGDGQARALLSDFALKGHISADALHSGVIRAVIPNWMKTAQAGKIAQAAEPIKQAISEEPSRDNSLKKPMKSEDALDNTDEEALELVELEEEEEINAKA